MVRNDDAWDNARWCEHHKQYHGILYTCNHYTDEVKKEVGIRSNKHIENLNDPEWCRRQVDKGLPEIGISIFKVFAGIKPL